VTTIELMPVAQFSGSRGWGYDGVQLYAPHNAYGHPDDLKHLIDTAHARGLMVLLDVVYNHFGPDGNYLHALAPAFFEASRHTPWGAAIDYTEPAVRAFAIENALYWLEEFRFDGLRLDAIDQIIDPSPRHVLVELAETVRQRLPGREVHLTTEDASNETRLHERDAGGHPRLYTAEWNDDFHHAAHVAATAESEGYYQDYTHPAELMARILAEGFAYQGEASRTWEGAPRGAPSAHLPTTAFIDFIQNHDQIGNRALGERLTTLASPAAVEALTATLLLSPHIPLLFMGEEWAETAPFLFFTDFHDELANAVRDGRRREFAKWRAFSDRQARKRIPDPNAWTTFERSRIDWARRDLVTGGKRLMFVRDLIALRTRELIPRLAGIRGHTALRSGATASLAHAAWRLADGAVLSLTVNLADQPADVPAAFTAASDGVPAFDPATALFAHPDGTAADLAAGRLGPWAIAATLSPRHTSGRRTGAP
jgi:malto-oligosyltrehalose trehalohydrolase